MSKSLKRVIADAHSKGIEIDPVRLEDGTTTAQQAANAAGCEVDQIVKSIIFRASAEGEHVLFLTAGGNRVDIEKASVVAGIPLEKADAASIRTHTGFAIGGVSPLGHISPIRIFFDPHILTFSTIWAAAGTPHHVFQIAPEVLRETLDAKVADFTETR